MQILIKTMTGKTMRLDVEPEKPIRCLKWLIEYHECIPFHQQRLVTSEKVLEDDEIIADYAGVQLHLQRRLNIFVWISWGKSIIVDVWDGDCIAEVKAKIHEMQGIPPSRQRLIFAGQWLQDHCALSELCIRQGDTIECNLLIDISVEDENGEIQTMQIDASESIGTIMQRVASTFDGIPQREQHWMILRSVSPVKLRPRLRANTTAVRALPDSEQASAFRGRSRSLRRGVRGGSPEGTRCRSQESQASKASQESQGSKASQESQGSKASQESPPGGQPHADASDIGLAEYPCGTRKFMLFQRQRGWNLWTPGLPRNVRARLNRRWSDMDIDDSDQW
jgi:hypothetical protein